jgi:glycosyltransferase involved in cell wall biosynthesis
LQALTGRHVLTLACYTSPDLSFEKKLETLATTLISAPPTRSTWIERLGGRFQPSANLKTAIMAQTESYGLVLGDGLASWWLAAEIVKAKGERGLLWLRPGERPPANPPAMLSIATANQVEGFRWLPEGLDTAYFKRQTPVNITSNEVIFRQVPGEAASEEALAYLLKEVWPAVRQLKAQASLAIVTPGTDGFEEIEEKQAGVSRISGATDWRNLYESGRLAVLPYRTTPTDYRPFQEAWAMQLPIVTMRSGALALPGLQLGDHYVQGADGPSLAALVARLLEIRGPGLHLVQEGRKLVEAEYTWSACAARLEAFWDELT